MRELKDLEEEAREKAKFAYERRMAHEAIQKKAEEEKKLQKMMQRAFKKELLPAMRQDFAATLGPLVQKQIAEWFQLTLAPALATCSPQAAALLHQPQAHLAAPIPNPSDNVDPPGIATCQPPPNAHPVYGNIPNPISFGPAFDGPPASSSQARPDEEPRDPALSNNLQAPEDQNQPNLEEQNGPPALFDPLEGLEGLSQPNLGMPEDPEEPKMGRYSPLTDAERLVAEALMAPDPRASLRALPTDLGINIEPFLLPGYFSGLKDSEDSDQEPQKPNKKRRTE